MNIVGGEEATNLDKFFDPIYITTFKLKARVYLGIRFMWAAQAIRFEGVEGYPKEVGGRIDNIDLGSEVTEGIST